MALNFTKFAQEGNSFLKEYTHAHNLGDDTEKAGRILAAILHGLRDIISINESLQLIAQFPMFLKAVYVNGWSPVSKKPRVKSISQFIDLVREHNGVTSVNDFGSDELASRYIDTTFIILRKYISLGELEDIRTELPKDLKSMVYHNLMF
ncbi:DUF2267 domain-containing protein [Ascidiimonas aurantiaca]|uniref:DUF2267 domain-containing protein n=1 Tax=Ascidiimonas aurantiaca TaxID=1685432 RepID=UPI0030ED6A07